MNTRRLDSAIGRFAAILEAQGQNDGELLERFIRQKDEAAFATLVRRQGPMVLGVCRRVLGNEHDAEDAFQATFFVLARKAASVRPRGRVGTWLYGVAYRTAQEARRAATRRRAREAKAMPRVEVSEQVHDDLRQVLDEELARLPDRYREVVVLCELQSRGRKDVARQLGCPEGTVASRLARARTLLAARLTRRGVAFSGGSVAAVLAQNSASGCVPATLVSATVKAATLFAAGHGAAATLISAQVFSLTEKVVKTMFLMKLKGMMAVVLLVGTLGSGAGWVYYQGATAAQPGPGRVSPTQAGGPAESKEDQLRREVVLLKRELQKAMDKVATLEANLTAKQDARTEVRFKAKPASFWIAQLQDRSAEYRVEAVQALGGIGEVDRSVIPVLVASLQDRNDGVCDAAVQAIFGVGKEAIPNLLTALEDVNQRKRIYFIRALTQFGEDAKAAVPALIRLLKAPDRADGLAAAQALGAFKLEAKATVPALIPLLKNTTNMDCYVAAKALGQIGPEAKAAVPALIELLGEKKEVPTDPDYVRMMYLGVAARVGGGSSAIGNASRGGKGGGAFQGRGVPYNIPAVMAATALGKIGPVAKAAIPALLEVLKNTPPQNQFGVGPRSGYPFGLEDAVINAIQQIDPMAAPPQNGPGGRKGFGGGGGGPPGQ